jgi:hypothetical protein
MNVELQYACKVLLEFLLLLGCALPRKASTTEMGSASVRHRVYEVDSVLEVARWSTIPKNDGPLAGPKPTFGKAKIGAWKEHLRADLEEERRQAQTHDEEFESGIF